MDLAEGLRPFLGQCPKGKDFEAVVSAICEHLPKQVPWDIVFESVRYMVGQQMTGDLLREACWRLAGNVTRLKQHRAVQPWVVQRHLEWVPAKIDRVTLRRGGRRGAELGHEFLFQVLGGTCCPANLTQWWSLKKQRHMAKFRDHKGHGFHFSRRGSDNATAIPKYRYFNAHQLVKLRCMLLIDPDFCDEDGPGFREIGFTSALSAWNIEQLKRRARLDAKHTCPMNFPRSSPCHKCPIGLDRCNAATHSATYVFKLCKKCGKEEYHDPADRAHEICARCVEAAVIKPEEED